MTSRVLELATCADPHTLLRTVAANVPDLAPIAEKLAPREDAPPVGTVELPGARVHVIPLQQEQRADGTITPPAAVVIVDGVEAEAVAALLDKALLAKAEAPAEAVAAVDYAELPGGAKVLLAGPSLISDVVAREPPAVRLARADELRPVRPVRPSGGGKARPEGETG